MSLIEKYLLQLLQTGIDVFKIEMSKTKRTIVALGDKDGFRKLIMLQIVRQKVGSQL